MISKKNKTITSKTGFTEKAINLLSKPIENQGLTLKYKNILQNDQRTNAQCVESLATVIGSDVLAINGYMALRINSYREIANGHGWLLKLGNKVIADQMLQLQAQNTTTAQQLYYIRLFTKIMSDMLASTDIAVKEKAIKGRNILIEKFGGECSNGDINTIHALILELVDTEKNILETLINKSISDRVQYNGITGEEVADSKLHTVLTKAPKITASKQELGKMKIKWKKNILQTAGKIKINPNMLARDIASYVNDYSDDISKKFIVYINEQLSKIFNNMPLLDGTDNSDFQDYLKIGKHDFAHGNDHNMITYGKDNFLIKYMLEQEGYITLDNNMWYRNNLQEFKQKILQESSVSQYSVHSEDAANISEGKEIIAIPKSEISNKI